LDGEIDMNRLSQWEWIELCALLYALCFLVVAKLLRMANHPKNAQVNERTRRPLVGWTAMLLAPLSLVGVALWSVWEILVIIKCSIARHARLGNQTEGDR